MNPAHSSTEGLIDSLDEALGGLGLEDICDREQVLMRRDQFLWVVAQMGLWLINIGIHNGMKGQLQSALPWLYWAWCYSRNLELACKDPLTILLFANISEMLLCLYYLYKKSPNKSQALATIIHCRRAGEGTIGTGL